jgi:hypothetical protein
LQALESHASLTENRNGIADTNLGSFDGGNAVAERLQARSFVVRDAFVDMRQRNLGQQGIFREAARKLETNDRPLAAKMTPARRTQGTGFARQLSAGRDSVATSETSHTFANLYDAHTEFVPEELNGRLSL